MKELTVSEVFEFLRTTGLVGALFFFIYGGYKRWWVYGHQYDDVLRERDAWRESALKNGNFADRSLELARKDHRS